MPDETGQPSSGKRSRDPDAKPDEASKVGTGVLRWRGAPVNAAEVILGSLPSILASLIGDLGCRVLIGLTEDLTAMVLRVYSEDQTLAVFPRTQDDWDEVQKWAAGPTVLEDIRQHGEVAEDRPRRRRR